MFKENVKLENEMEEINQKYELRKTEQRPWID